MSAKPNIVIFGAGAIGSTIAAWISEVHEETYILARNDALETINRDGLVVSSEGTDKTVRKIKTLKSLYELDNIDVIVLCVKNYSLHTAAKHIRDHIGDKALVVSIQNGVENQVILPQYFTKVVYGVAQHNAWKTGPNEVVYNRRKPLILEESELFRSVLPIFQDAMPVVVTDRFQDAAHSKLIANLTNSMLSLGGKPECDHELRALHYLFAKVLMESIRTLEAAGHRQFPLDGIPSWSLLKLMSCLPLSLSRGRFKRGLQEVRMTSMQQDIQNGQDSELDTINGYLLKLADEHGLIMPYSRALYELCKEQFGRSAIQPITYKEVLSRIRNAAQARVDNMENNYCIR